LISTVALVAPAATTASTSCCSSGCGAAAGVTISAVLRAAVPRLIIMSITLPPSTTRG
jgi:hypothetical protein